VKTCNFASTITVAGRLYCLFLSHLWKQLFYVYRMTAVLFLVPSWMAFIFDGGRYTARIIFFFTYWWEPFNFCITEPYGVHLKEKSFMWTVRPEVTILSCWWSLNCVCIRISALKKILSTLMSSKWRFTEWALLEHITTYSECRVYNGV